MCARMMLKRCLVRATPNAGRRWAGREKARRCELRRRSLNQGSALLGTAYGISPRHHPAYIVCRYVVGIPLAGGFYQPKPLAGGNNVP